MKKCLLFFMGVVLFGLTGCSTRYFDTWFHSEQEEADQMCQNIIDAYTQQDSEKLKNIGLYKLEIATEEEVNKEDFVWDNAEMGIFVEEKKETVL